jgi:nucleoside-diphosphate-sugar epimerase
MNKQKRIVVAGGAGFIGSHLCTMLLKKGHEVFCLDNLSTGRKINITPLLSSKLFHFIKTDTRILSVRRFSVYGTIDEIYDLASPASVTYITEYPVVAATANSVGTMNLLSIAMDRNARFLFASSSEAYGDPLVHPQPESYWGNVNPVGVRSGYDEGKRFGEALVMAYYRQYGTQTRIARIFNTFGPNSSPTDSRVIPRFVTQALRGDPITVHGDGRQTRSFCYVSDLVDGLVALMESSYTEPINLGNPQEITIIDVAKKVIEMSHSASTILFVDRPENDPGRRKPDITRAKGTLLWEPSVTLEEGLFKTIEYFSNLP